MTLLKLKQSNPHIEISEIHSSRFLQYGRALNFDCAELMKHMLEEVPIPSEGNIYIPSDEAMEAFDIKKAIECKLYGEMPIQIGYCNGQNQCLNGFEYHKCSEVNIAVTDLVLLVGRLQDIRSSRYPSGNAEAFYIPKGAIVELYGTTLHFSPCKVYKDGFKCIVILPKGTNLPLDSEPGTGTETGDEEERLLFARNKWLTVHRECSRMVTKGAFVGIDGNNVKINCIKG